MAKRLGLYTSALALALILTVTPQSKAQQCSVQVTDLTDWSPAVLSPLPESRGLTFRAVASGARSGSVEVWLSSVPGSHVGTNLRDIVSETPESRTSRVFCLRPGPYEIIGYAVCPDGNATHTFYPFEVPDVAPEVRITDVEPLLDGRYKIGALFGLPTGRSGPGYEWIVYPRISDGVYGPPVRYQTSVVNGAMGDRVVVNYYVCSGSDDALFGTAETILPAPPSVDVAVLSGDGQRAVLGEAAEQPLRVKFTASDPSFDLTTISANFEIVSVPAGANDYGVGATEGAVSSSYSVPVAADGTAGSLIVVGDQPGAYVVRVRSPITTTGSQAIFSTTAVKPASVGIVKDTTDQADLAAAYAVSASDPTSFYAIGLDVAGQRIGPMKCDWSASASGNPRTRGEGTLAPAVATKTASFQRSSPAR